MLHFIISRAKKSLRVGALGIALTGVIFPASPLGVGVEALAHASDQIEPTSIEELSPPEDVNAICGGICTGIAIGIVIGWIGDEVLDHYFGEWVRGFLETIDELVAAAISRGADVWAYVQDAAERQQQLYDDCVNSGRVWVPSTSVSTGSCTNPTVPIAPPNPYPPGYGSG